METRANYLLIGAFTLAGFFGLLGFFLWFARIELDRQFAYYDITFPAVAALTNASEVRFAGLLVGQVVDVSLNPDQSGLVQVRVEVQANTPVRTSSVASIESYLVTGVSYVSIAAGDPADPLLSEVSDDPFPDIPAARSSFQSLTEDAPAILDELLQVTRRLSEVLGPENQGRVAGILANVEASSGSLDQALQDVSNVTETIATASQDIATFTARLEGIADSAATTLETADASMQRVTALADRIETTFDTGDVALESATRTLDSANTFIEGDLSALARDLRETTAMLREEVARIGADASATLEEFRGTGAAATARLEQVQGTVATADTVLADLGAAADDVQAAARSFDALMTGEGAAAVGDARTLMQNANSVVTAALDVAETDLPAILEDIRGAADTASRVVAQVGEDLSAAAGQTSGIATQASETLATVADTFEAANGTLERLNTALEAGDSALAAAESAFSSADRVLNDDLGAMSADLRETLDRLDTAIASVSSDATAIAGDLRETAAQANAAFGQLRSTADQLGPALRGFAAEGLPQYSRLAREARNLVGSLDQLVRSIERDPSRYLFGRDQPEFRR